MNQDDDVQFSVWSGDPGNVPTTPIPWDLVDDHTVTDGAMRLWALLRGAATENLTVEVRTADLPALANDLSSMDFVFAVVNLEAAGWLTTLAADAVESANAWYALQLHDRRQVVGE